MPNSGSCKKNSHSVSLQCQLVTYLSICQIVIGILGHISRCVFCLNFLCMVLLPIHSICLLSEVWIKLVFPSDISLPLLLLFPLPTPPFLSLSPFQPAISGCPDGDEEGRWGQCHLTMPPSVPIIQLSGHRVATAETKLQTESGEIRFPLFSVCPHFQCYSYCGKQTAPLSPNIWLW